MKILKSKEGKIIHLIPFLPRVFPDTTILAEFRQEIICGLIIPVKTCFHFVQSIGPISRS